MEDDFNKYDYLRKKRKPVVQKIKKSKKTKNMYNILTFIYLYLN